MITKQEVALIRMRFICGRLDDIYDKTKELLLKNEDWFKKNLKERKACRADIKELELSLDYWSTSYISAPNETLWFITDRIDVVNYYLEKSRRKLFFLNQIYKERRAEEKSKKTGEPILKPKFKTYNIERIKEIKIKTILDQAGVKIEGKNFFKLRNEKTASTHFNEDGNYWHDFGSGDGGDVISLYQKLHSCDFKTAIKELNYLI